MKYLFLLCTITFIAVPEKSYAQEKNTYLPAWSYHDKNSNIIGLSVGLWTARNMPRDRNTDSYGLKVELVGVGLLAPLVPRSPAARDIEEFKKISKSEISENVYGISISTTGTFCECKLVGISVGGIGQYNFKVNGLSVSPMVNFAQVHNGIQVSTINDSFRMRGLQFGFRNNSFYSRGIQIGLFNRSSNSKGLQIGFWTNHSSNLKGLQIGFWNVNQERKFPIINWAL